MVFESSLGSFMYVVLEGDVMRIEAVVPATDFSRQSEVEKIVSFPRRNR
jgi:hypothetical protein